MADDDVADVILCLLSSENKSWIGSEELPLSVASGPQVRVCDDLALIGLVEDEEKLRMVYQLLACQTCPMYFVFQISCLASLGGQVFTVKVNIKKHHLSFLYISILYSFI